MKELGAQVVACDPRQVNFVHRDGSLLLLLGALDHIVNEELDLFVRRIADDGDAVPHLEFDGSFTALSLAQTGFGEINLLVLHIQLEKVRANII